MKLLSIDTSIMVSGCTISEDGNIIGDYNVNQEKTHSESLVPMVNRLLNDLGIKLKDIDIYAIGVGPGSFTGLRIGMTTVKTFAQVFNKPVVAVSTLEALAHNINKEGIILSLLDARGGRTYYGIFKRENGKLVRIEKDELDYMDELVKRLIGKYDSITVVGEYTEDSEKLLNKISNISYVSKSLNNLIARSICDLAYEKYLLNETEDYRDILPNYVRKSQAQRDLEKRK